MTVFVDSTTGLVDETPCAGCGWPVCSCLCEDGDLVNWQARAEAAEADARECRAERARYGDAMTEQLADVEAERDALRSEVATYRKTLDEVSEIGTSAIDERDALRAALVSLVDGKSEFDIEYDTGMPADEARRIMDLAYNRK